MRLSAKALAFAGALLWGGGILFVGLINLASPTYGADFLRVMASLYPGFDASRTAADVLIGTLYGLMDGAVCGLLGAWVYNWAAARDVVMERTTEAPRRAA
jgi:hypothetical protein